MEDMNEMLGSLLSDPESMQQIKELAEMLSSGGDMQGGSVSEGTAAVQGTAGGDGIDLSMLAGMGKLMSAADGSDRNSALLLALRPHLSEERRQRVDKALKMLRAYAVFEALRDSGMLKDIL